MIIFWRQYNVEFPHYMKHDKDDKNFESMIWLCLHLQYEMFWNDK